MYLVSSQALIYRYTEAEENVDGREYAYYEVSTAIRPQQVGNTSSATRVPAARRLQMRFEEQREAKARKAGGQAGGRGDDNGPRGRG